MADRIALEIAAPEHARVHMMARQVIIPGAAGVFTVLPGHTPLLTTLLPGVVVAEDEGGEEHFFAVNRGFAEVTREAVTLLVDTFEPGRQVDLERAQAAYERATQRLERSKGDIDLQRAELAMARSFARIQAGKRKGY